MSRAARTRSAPRRWGPRAIATRLIIGAAAVLPFVALAFDGLNQSAPAAIGAGVAMLVATAAVLLFGRERLIPLRQVYVPTIALGLAMLAGMARIAFPLAGLDQDPGAIPIELVKIAGFAACTITGLLIAAHPRRLERLLAWIVYAGGIYVIVALVAGEPLIVEVERSQIERFGGTLANTNAAGCAFGMLALLALGRARALVQQPQFYQFESRHIAALGATGAIAFFAFAACALTQSRTALAGTIILALVLLLGDIRRGKLIALAAIGALVVVVAALLEVGDATAGRLDTLTEDAASRWAGYRHLAGVVGEAPWFGHGLGSFMATNVAHLNATRAPSMWNWGAGHNIIIHALVEGGWAVTAPILAAWGAIAVQIARGASATAGASAPVAAVVLALLCASVDIALNVPAVAAFTALLLGVAWGSHTLSVRRGSSARLLLANQR